MIQITRNERLTKTYSEQQLAELLEILDHLHSAASEGRTDALTAMNKRELIAFLREVIYTAEETIAEIDKTVCYRQTSLRLVEKSTA